MQSKLSKLPSSPPAVLPLLGDLLTAGVKQEQGAGTWSNTPPECVESSLGKPLVNAPGKAAGIAF